MHDEPPESSPGADAATPAPATTPVPNNPPTEPETDAPTDETAASPAWANDLRKLYNAVVEEPLPDSLIALLAQLDSED